MDEEFRGISLALKTLVYSVSDDCKLKFLGSQFHLATLFEKA